jgi:hypothetical protein
MGFGDIHGPDPYEFKGFRATIISHKPIELAPQTYPTFEVLRRTTGTPGAGSSRTGSGRTRLYIYIYIHIYIYKQREIY